MLIIECAEQLPGDLEDDMNLLVSSHHADSALTCRQLLIRARAGGALRDLKVPASSSSAMLTRASDDR